MTKRALSVGFLAVALLPSMAFAQAGVGGPTTASCLEDVYDAFGREHRLARAVLFGSPSAEDAPITGVLYDGDGNAWVKTADDEWKSAAEGATPLDDGAMDARRETDPLCDNEGDVGNSCVTLPRRGIFETRKTPTSDLIHPIVQSIRALQCRLRAVCHVAAASPLAAEGERITAELDGCVPMTYPAFEGCRSIDPDVFQIVPGNCQEARRRLVEREMQLLVLATAYDASYRSTAQFAGMFQEFLLQFRFPLIEPLWQAVRMLGGLKDIPCFQAECNE